MGLGKLYSSKVSNVGDKYLTRLHEIKIMVAASFFPFCERLETVWVGGSDRMEVKLTEDGHMEIHCARETRTTILDEPWRTDEERDGPCTSDYDNYFVLDRDAMLSEDRWKGFGGDDELNGTGVEDEWEDVEEEDEWEDDEEEGDWEDDVEEEEYEDL